MFSLEWIKDSFPYIFIWYFTTFHTVKYTFLQHFFISCNFFWIFFLFVAYVWLNSNYRWFSVVLLVHYYLLLAVFLNNLCECWMVYLYVAVAGTDLMVIMCSLTTINHDHHQLVPFLLFRYNKQTSNNTKKTYDSSPSLKLWNCS